MATECRAPGCAETKLCRAPLSSVPEAEVVLHRYASSVHDAHRFVFMPLRIRSGALNAFTMGLGGFLVWTKVDRRPTDPVLAPFVINAATELSAPTVRLEETAEYAYLQRAARVDRARGGFEPHKAASGAPSAASKRASAGDASPRTAASVA